MHLHLLVVIAACLVSAGVSLGQEGDILRQKCQEAFPDGVCERSKSLIYFTSTRTLIACDGLRAAGGKLVLKDAAFAFFSEGKTPTTVRADVAFVTMSGNPTSLTDLMKQKIVAIELPGGMQLTIPR